MTTTTAQDDERRAQVDAEVRDLYVTQGPRGLMAKCRELMLAQPVAQEAIPSGVHYGAQFDNFYDSATLAGMGTPFYLKWKDRRDEFPNAPLAAPQPSQGAEELESSFKSIKQAATNYHPETAAFRDFVLSVLRCAATPRQPVSVEVSDEQIINLIPRHEVYGYHPGAILEFARAVLALAGGEQS